MYDRDEIILRPNSILDGKPSHDPFWFNVYTSADFYWRYRRNEEQNPEDIVGEDFDLVDLTRLYYGAISCVDDLVGRLLTKLSDIGILDNTMIVFVSDHGDNLGSHGLFNKNSLIEESIRIPFIVYDPRYGQRVINEDHIASIIDVMPTVLELVGIPVPDHIQGSDLSSLVTGQVRDLLDTKAFIETGPMIGIRTPRYMFGIDYDAEKHQIIDQNPWFYDIIKDRYQFSNISSLDEVSSDLRTLRDDLFAWDKRTSWLAAPKHIPQF
jgi:arylsulfatase A-like enzyme